MVREVGIEGVGLGSPEILPRTRAVMCDPGEPPTPSGWRGATLSQCQEDPLRCNTKRASCLRHGQGWEEGPPAGRLGRGRREHGWSVLLNLLNAERGPSAPSYPGPPINPNF